MKVDGARRHKLDVRPVVPEEPDLGGSYTREEGMVHATQIYPVRSIHQPDFFRDFVANQYVVEIFIPCMRFV